MAILTVGSHMASKTGSSRRLSTGHEVELPLELAFAMGGVVVPARRSRVARALPDRLSPLALAPGIAPVTLVGIQYRRVGGRDGGRAESGANRRTGLEPYDEFGVVIPCVRDGGIGPPLAGEVGGYVHWLPVTTGASVALGRELWGYPKERADVRVVDGPNGIRVIVEVDGDRVLRVEVSRTRRPERKLETRSYTTKDGTLVRTRAEIEGGVGLGSGLGARVELGDGPRADELRELGLRPRPIARLYGTRVEARLHPGERRASRE